MPVADDRYVIPSRAGNSAGTMQLAPTPVPAGRFTSPRSPSEPVPFVPEPAQSSPANETGHGGVAGGTGVSDGIGQPGDRQLEGPQNARVTLQKMAPPEIQVGRPAVLRTVVHNAGPASAADVEIRDQVPRGTRLLGTAPRAAEGRNGELVWSLGTIKPGGETTVEMQIMPTDEGEIGSVATVRFQTVATARSMVTRPKLVVQTAGPPRILAGDEALLTFTVSNPGSGVATGVSLIERIPAGMKHPAGAELEYSVGDLKPGESRQLQLRLKAVQAGTITNVISARGDANLRAEHRFNFEVASAKLEMAVNGPKRRYLEREATYQFSVTNPGTAPAQQVRTDRLPTGGPEIRQRQQRRTLRRQHPGRLLADGRAAGQTAGHGRAGHAAGRGGPVQPEGPRRRPAGSGGRKRTAGASSRGWRRSFSSFRIPRTRWKSAARRRYEISVVNQGSKASSNLQISVFLPPELKPLAAEGPTRYTIEGNKVVFESLPQLAPKSVAAFRVRAQGLRPGDLRIRCQLMTDEMQRPVVKEESTRVYADE